jgi:hypothetical protein
LKFFGQSRATHASNGQVPLEFLRERALCIDYVEWLGNHGHGGIGQFLNEFMSLGSKKSTA